MSSTHTHTHTHTQTHMCVPTAGPWADDALSVDFPGTHTHTHTHTHIHTHAHTHTHMCVPTAGSWSDDALSGHFRNAVCRDGGTPHWPLRCGESSEKLTQAVKSLHKGKRTRNKYAGSEDHSPNKREQEKPRRQLKPIPKGKRKEKAAGSVNHSPR